LYTLTTNKIANQFGKTYTWEIKTRLMGLMGREAAVAITAALELPMTPEEYMTESQEIMSQLFSDCTVLPGQKQCAVRNW
jgi:pseudouridine 5'-phosphatase